MENSILHNRGTGNEPLTIQQLHYDFGYILEKKGDWPDEFFGSRNCCVFYYFTRLIAKYYSFIQENKETSKRVRNYFCQLKERINYFAKNLYKIKNEQYIQEDPERYERFKTTLEKYQKLYGCQPEVEEDKKVEEDNYVSVYYNSYI